jgi:hypothetical protein
MSQPAEKGNTNTATVPTADTTTTAAAGAKAEAKAEAAAAKPEAAAEKSLLAEGAEASEAGKETTEAAKVPEKYDAWKLPEGVTMDAALNERFLPVARELGLTQEAAQKVVGLYADYVQKQNALAQQAQAEALRAARNSIQDDPNFKANMLLANRGFATVPERFKAQFEGPLGDHPAVFWLMTELGRRLGEDSPVGGGRGSAPPKDARTADVLFGDVVKKS